jgi:hypothetical protein
MERGTATRSLRQPVGLALAGAVAAAGLWLAVSAGAEGGSARDAGYPQYAYRTKITGHPPKTQAAVASPALARAAAVSGFRFHAVFSQGGQRVKPLPPNNHFRCKLDGRKYRRCSSPKRYRGLSKGRHRFRVKLVYQFQQFPPVDQSAPAVFRWKIE